MSAAPNQDRYSREEVHDRLEALVFMVLSIRRGLWPAAEARTRILSDLSDGRPDDEDGYRGDYGIEDTRRAVLEARGQGIQTLCVTIDDQAQDYLPHMVGRAHYTVVEDVAKLPYKVSDIYRRITV